MSIFLADRVCEVAAVTGTPTLIQLGGAVSTYNSFLTANPTPITGGQQARIVIYVATIGYERWLATYISSTNTFTLNTLLSSSNNGARVNFPAGSTAEIYNDIGALEAVTTDTLQAQTQALFNAMMLTWWGTLSSGVPSATGQPFRFGATTASNGTVAFS